MGKTPEELYKERRKRVQDTIQLRVPDRVPIKQHDFCVINLPRITLI